MLPVPVVALLLAVAVCEVVWVTVLGSPELIVAAELVIVV